MSTRIAFANHDAGICGICLQTPDSGIATDSGINPPPRPFFKHLLDVFPGRDIKEHNDETFHNHGTRQSGGEPCEFQRIQTPEFCAQRPWNPSDETVNRTQHARGNLHSYEDRNLVLCTSINLHEEGRLSVVWPLDTLPIVTDSVSG
jgi:hypothetical protein